MERSKNCSPAKSRFMWVLLPVLVLLPAFIMACGEQPTDVDQISDGSMPKSVSIADLGVSLNLPEGWVEYQKPLRATQADKISQLSEEMLKLEETDNPRKLEMGANFYSYNNLDQYGSIPDDELFGNFLTIQMHNYMSRARRELWKSGLCNPDQYCAEKFNPRFKLIRKLDSDENPFDNGAGFLFETKMEDKQMAPRWVYIYYLVNGEKCYKIMLDGAARDFEDNAYPELLAGIHFSR